MKELDEKIQKSTFTTILLILKYQLYRIFLVISFFGLLEIQEVLQKIKKGC